MALVTESNRKWWSLGAVTFSLFLTYLDTTVVNVALPSISRDFDTSIQDLAWVLNGYLITYAVFLLTGGRLADYLGRRRIFLVGLTIFTVMSLFCGAATSDTMLIVARAAQGVGSALMLPGSHSIIAATFPPHQRGLAFGIWTGFAGLGLAGGPLVGGLIVEGIDWRWIFYVNLPLGVLGFAAALLFVRESRDTSAEQRLDLPGLVSAAAALFLLTFALLQGDDYGWSSAVTVSCFVGAALALAAFVVLERVQRAPMLDLSVFRNVSFVGAIYSALIVLFAMFGVLFFTSFYLQGVLRYSPIEAGAIFLPMTVMFLAVAPVAGRLTDKLGPRWPIASGMALLGVGLLLFSRLDESSNFWDVFPGLVVGGIGMGLAVAPATVAVITSLPIEKAGVGSGLLNTHRQMGGNLGIAVMTAIVAAQLGNINVDDPRFAAAFVDGYQDAILVSGLLSIAGGVMAAITIRRRPQEEAPGTAEAVGP